MKLQVELDLAEWIADGSVEDEIIRRISHLLFKQIEKTVTVVARKNIEKSIEDRISALTNEYFNKVIDEGIPLTNPYGEKKGTTTLREIIIESNKKYLNAKQPIRGTKKSLTKAEAVIQEICNETIKTTTDEEVKKVAEQARTYIQRSVSEYLAHQLAPTIEAPKIKASP